MQGISRQTDYAVRTVLHLASRPEGPAASMGDIGKERRLPSAFVRRFVKKLVDSGIVATARGKGGGLRLARPASDITLLDVVQSTGGIQLNHCVGAPGACAQAPGCLVRGVWARATAELEKYLSSVRFSDLATEMNGHSKKMNDRSVIF